MKRSKSSSNEGFFSNWQVKILCFVFAVLVFVMVYYTGMETRRVSLPLDVILPENYEAVSVIPESSTLLVMGDGEDIYLINPDSVRLYADFSAVSRSGIAVVPVQVDYESLEDYVDLSEVYFRSSPLFVRIYFEEKQ
ncbi:MAG: hypothetical protein K6F82_03475 [Sphaerochaetaceae bacterium]|nr:hypothetical protein [Sphaerochaetaceae bacterium]